MMFLDVENNKFSIPPWKELMQYRVVACSCLEASILVGAHCTNELLMDLEEGIVNSLHPHRRFQQTIQPHWTHLLIDEVIFYIIVKIYSNCVG